MKNIVLLTVISTLIQGCTSIAQPTASRPLVEHEYVTPIASANSSLSASLSNAKAGDKLVVGQQPAVMGDVFFAATGLTCRKLVSEPVRLHIYCLNTQGRWFKVKKVISEYNESAMSGGSL